MKLNNLSRLTALLLALTMILPVFAAAEDTYTTFGELTDEVLTTYDSVAAMVADNKCSLCAETLVNRNILTWPVNGYDCLHTYLATMTSNQICQFLYDLDTGTSDEYTLGQAYINAHNSHVDSTDETLKRDPVICYGLSCYTNPPINPGPDHVDGCPWKQDTLYTPVVSRTLTSGAVTVSGKMPADVQLAVSAATVDTSIMDLSYFDSYDTFGYNIALYRPGADATIGTDDDIKWQPKDSGETVTVTIAKAYSVDNYPAVDVYHVKDDTTMELLTSRNGSVALTEDGTSFSFTVDEFSTFHCAAGLWSLNLSDMSGTSHTINVIAGLETTLQLIVRDTSATISPATVGSGFVAPTSTTITDDEDDTATMFTIGTTTASQAGTSQTYTVKWDNEEVTVTLNVVTKEKWSITYPGTTVDHIQINLTFDAVITDDDGNTTTATVKIPTPNGSSGNWGSSTNSTNYSPTSTSSTTSFTTYAEDQTVTTTVNGTSQSLTTDTAVKIEIVDPTSYGYSYPSSQSFSVSSITNKESQLSFNGSFPIGVFGAPVIYRVTIDTTIKIPVTDSAGNTTYKEQQVSLSKLIYYWHPDNICPGAKGTYDTGVTPGNSSGNHGGGGNAGGIDIGEFGASIDGTGSLALTKALAEPLAEAKTFKIYVYKSQENTTESTDDDWVKMDQFTVEITVPAGDTTATKTIVDIPYGTYKIVEDTVDTDSYKPNIDGYTLTVEYTTIKIVDGEEQAQLSNEYTFSKDARLWKANVKNTYTAKTGNLVIIKQVEGTPEGYTPDVFTFTVTLSDTTIGGTYGDATFTDGVAPLILKGGQTATITGIPAGTTYTVTEAAVPGYTTQYQASDDKGDDTDNAVVTGLSKSGEIDAAGTDTVTFTNTYSVGKLSITKNVVGATAPAEAEFPFVVNFTPITGIPLAASYNYVITSVVDGTTKQEETGTVANGGSITLQNGQTATISGIQAGVGYTVTENTPETDFPYTVTKTGDAGKIAANATQAAVFTNTYTKGDLTITKTVTVSGESSTQKFEFTLTGIPEGRFEIVGATDQDGVNLSTIANGGKFYLTGGGSATIKDLPDDTVCTVTETPVAGYATTANGQASLHGSATIKQGETVTISFVNTYSVADLTITKEVEVENGVSIPDQAFTIEVALEAADNAVLASTYAYTKTDTAGTTKGEFLVNAGKLSFALKDSEKIVIHGLQTDTKYTVTEASAQYYTAEITPSAQTTLTNDATVAVVNTYNTGNLTVTKWVEGTYAPKDSNGNYESFTFTLGLSDNNVFVNCTISDSDNVTTLHNGDNFTLTHGQTATIYGIPVGVTYTVTEAENTDYTTTVNNTAGYSASAQMTDADATVAFVNTYKYSRLTITKTVASAPTGIADQEFNLTVTLPDGGSYPYTVNGTAATPPLSAGANQIKITKDQVIVIDKLPIGGEFSVVEGEISYFNPSCVYTPTANSSSIVDTGNTVAITNTYNPGSLTITKTVVGVTAPADDEFEFTVTLTPAVTGVFSYTKGTDTATLEFTEGAAEIKLKDGESITFTNLPQGVTYKVEEKADEVSAKYTPTSNGAEGTISEIDSTANFTNTYKFNDLTISKAVDNKSAALYEAPVVEFPFMLVLKDANNNTLTGKYKVKGSDKEIELGTTFNLKAGESITIQDLPVGATYAVTESAVEGFVLGSKTGETGSIEADQEYKATFTNEYCVGQLKISKKVEGADAPKDAEGNYSDVFKFNVSLKDATGTTMTGYTYKIGDDGEAKELTGFIELKDGQTAIIDKLPAETTYVITESHPDYTTTVDGEETNTVTGTIVAGSSSQVNFTNTYKYSHLTIKKTGMKSNTESAIFTVSNVEKTFTVVVPNEDSVTIGKLLIGDTYTVTESGNWTWLYTPSISPSSVKITEGGNTVNVTNSGTDKWLHDESGVINTYGTSGGTSID